MLNRILSYLEEQGYEENTPLKQWEINQAFDKVVSRDDKERQFDREVAKEMWDQTEKNQQDKVRIDEFLKVMENNNKLRYLFPKSYIFGSGQPQQGNQEPQQQQQQPLQVQPEPQYNEYRQSGNQNEKPDYSVDIQEYSQRQSTQQRENNIQNNESLSRMLNATLNESVEPGSSIMSESIAEIKIQQTNGSIKRQQSTKNIQNIRIAAKPDIKNLPNNSPKISNPQISLKATQSETSLNTPLLGQSHQESHTRGSPAFQQSLLTNQSSIVIQPLKRHPNVLKKLVSGIDQQHQFSGKKFKKTSKRCISKRWCIPMCLLVVGIVVYLSSFMIHSLLKDKVLDQVILKPENQGIWAHFPGDTKTEIDRNWTFFNIINPDGMLFHNEKPKFRQIAGFKIIQLEDYLNITYIEDGDRVQMVDWLRFGEQPESRNLDQKIEVLNVGGLGYWYNLKISRPTIILQQGLGLLFTTLEQSILENVYAQAIKVQFLTDDFATSYQLLFAPAGLTQDQGLFLWNDIAYGLSNQNNLKYWIQAVPSAQKISKQTVSQQYTYLKRYFTLQNNQLDYILLQFSSFMQFIQNAVLQNNYCAKTRSCTGRYLAYKQFATSYVTKNPPSGTPILPTDSICQSNTTCEGYFPQLQAYYEKVYLQRYPERNATLKWDDEWMNSLVNYNVSIDEKKDYNTAQNCLFHIGNLDALWDNGTMFDRQKIEMVYTRSEQDFIQNDNPNKYLENIRARFGLETVEHSHVFWNWIKYLTNQLILRNQTNQKLGVGNLFAKGLYQGFTYLQDNLQTNLLVDLIEKDIKTSGKQGDCATFIHDSLQIKDNHTALKFCDHYGQKITKPLIKKLLSVCNERYGLDWKHIKEGYSLLSINLQSLCDPQQPQFTFGQLLHKYRSHLDQLYSCKITPKEYCSDFQLAAIQWSSSQVTLNPPPQLNLQKTDTYQKWDHRAERFQYAFYMSKYQDQQFPQIDTKMAYKLLNFDNWFSASVALKEFVDPQVDERFKRYMRYVSIQVGLNGLTMKRSAREMMFGYLDPILDEVKHAYIPFGGDPSTPSLVAFNDPNITKQQAKLTLEWSTGKTNFTLVGQYRKINGLQYLTIQKDFFNGNVTTTSLNSPWQQNDYLYGTSAKQFSPKQFQSNNVSLYVPNIQRYGSGKLEDQVSQRFGFDVQYGYLGESILESTSQSDLNKKYYQKFHAIFNETSVVGIPLYVCKNHFMNTTANWSQLVEIWNQNKTIKYENASHWDDSFVVVEPYTGVSFQSTIYLQSNYYHQPDSLLSFYQESMLPIFSLLRSGNVTQEVANELFGPLRTGLTAVRWAKIIGIFIIVISCVVCGLIYFQIKRAQKKSESEQQSEDDDQLLNPKAIKKSQLGISLQPMSPAPEQYKGLVRQSLSDMKQEEQYIPSPVVSQEI